MPNNWKTYKLGEVADVQNGYAFKSKDLVESGIPVIKIKNIVPPNISLEGAGYFNGEIAEKLEKYIIKKGDFLISMTGSTVNVMSSAVGKMGRYRLDEDALLNQRAGKIYVTEPHLIDFEFLCQYLNRFEIHYNLALNATGSANQANISPAQIKNIQLNIPPLPEQKAIANILSAIDDKIENNLAINKTLEDMAMALYKHWFVDFGPFQDGEFVDSELGRIPKGWEVKSIYDLIDVVYGAPFRSKLFNEEKVGYPLIRIRDLKSGKPHYYTAENHNKKTIIEKGDILAGMDALFVPYLWCGETAVLNQRVVYFKPKHDYVTRGYIYEAVKPWLKYFEGAKVGTTVIHLSKGDIDTFNFPFPEKSSEIASFNSQIETLHKQKVNNYKENESLTQLRDTLLPKLISGEVRLKAYCESGTKEAIQNVIAREERTKQSHE